MSVRFVVGRAGSGKTHRCLQAVRAALRENPTAASRLLMLVPEQASFQMERALIETDQVTGFLRCEVLSFQRLAYRIFAETGTDPRQGDQTIGQLGRLMTLRRLIRRERSALRILDRVAEQAGLVRQVAGTIEELMREDIAPDVLADLAERSDADNPLAAAKLADLSRIYRAYLDYLIDDRLDPAQYLAMAAERLESCDFLADARVWVDGFAGFTHQEVALLVALARRVGSVEIALLVDPHASAVTSDELPGLSFSLFARTERTLVELRKAFRAAGVPVDEPVRLDPTEPPRFEHASLAAIEKNLFTSRATPTSEPPPREVVSVQRLPDRRSEVEAAVAEIQRLTREPNPPLRYRQMAVIVRDLNAYHDLLATALRSAEIPYFIDRREPTAHHPLIELIRGLLAVACDDCRLESVRLTLKTGLLPISDEQGDLLENYLLAHNITGRARFGQSWHYTRIFARKASSERLEGYRQEVLQRVDEARRAWLGCLAPWLDDACGEAQREGLEWASMLYGCLAHNEVGTRLEDWAGRAEQDGRPDEAQIHRQVWADLIELLDEFVHALGSEALTLAEFREAIEAALAEFDLGLAPPTLDQVMVGAIDRSRHPPVRAVLLLGFDAAHFPQRRSEDPLLGDQERETLERLGKPIGPSRQRQLLDERMLVYIALTRASQRLWISFPQSEVDSQPVEPSPFLGDLCAALPGLAIETVPDPRNEGRPSWIPNVRELGARLAGELRYRPGVSDDEDPSRRGLWNRLYEDARQHAAWRHTLLRALGGLAYTNTARLEEGLIDRAVKTPFLASVSRLERFAACPFAHFADYWLGLEPRVVSELEAVDVGTLCHAILEKFIDSLVKDERGLADLEDDQIAEGVDAAADHIVAQLTDEMLLSEGRNSFLADRSRLYMARVMRWQRQAAGVGRFKPRAVEYPFGYNHSRAFTLTTPRGRTIRLRGKIDRVDLADLGEELLGVVIDYKATTDRRLNFAEVFHGLSLQLVGYLLALQQTGESLTGRPVRPVAALYLPLLEPFEMLPHPDCERKRPYRWRGIVDLSKLETLDDTIAPGGGSDFLAAKLTRKGEPYANSDLAVPDQMKALMAHVGRCMGELADRLLDGDIAVSPYRLNKRRPCTFCAYLPLCRYEIATQPPRRLESFKKDEVLRRLAREGADG